MCFVLYIAADRPLPLIPWEPNADCVHTDNVPDSDTAIYSHFTRRHVYFVGSDTHCGCGYRNASYQNGSWPEEEWRPDDDTRHITAQPNHERLVRLVREHLAGEESFELYGAWESSFIDPTLCHQDITIERLLELDFYFRDRGHYTVSMSG